MKGILIALMFVATSVAVMAQLPAPNAAGTKDPIAPMRGHSLGLLGFEVTDIEGFVKRYQEAGGQFDGNGTIARAQAANLEVIQLTDPWRTSIEVSQGLVAAK